MKQAEENKLVRKAIRIRRYLHHAESLVYLDDLNSDDVNNALNYLSAHLPKELAHKVFHQQHLRKLTNFWLTASDRGQIKGTFNSDQIAGVFRAVAQYCNREELRHDGGNISISKPLPD